MATREKQKALVNKEERKLGLVNASLRNLPMSARKIRAVIAGIRNKDLNYALSFLSTQRKACSGPIIKLLESAAANADQRSWDIDDMVIHEIQVNKGPIRKRFMPRAQGRATKIRKQTSHIRVSLGK